MRILLLIPAMMMAACQTTPKPIVPATQTWEEFVRDHPSTYIQGRTEQLAAERLRLERLGLAKDYETIRGFVDAHLPPGNYASQEPSATAAILRRQRVDSLATGLSTWGMGPAPLPIRNEPKHWSSLPRARPQAE